VPDVPSFALCNTSSGSTMNRNCNAHVRSLQQLVPQRAFKINGQIGSIPPGELHADEFADALREHLQPAYELPLINLAPFAISVIRIDFELSADGVVNPSTTSCLRYPCSGIGSFSRRPGGCSNTLAATTFRRVR